MTPPITSAVEFVLLGSVYHGVYPETRKVVKLSIWDMIWGNTALQARRRIIPSVERIDNGIWTELDL